MRGPPGPKPPMRPPPPPPGPRSRRRPSGDHRRRRPWRRAAALAGRRTVRRAFALALLALGLSPLLALLALLALLTLLSLLSLALLAFGALPLGLRGLEPLAHRRLLLRRRLRADRARIGEAVAQLVARLLGEVHRPRVDQGQLAGRVAHEAVGEGVLDLGRGRRERGDRVIGAGRDVVGLEVQVHLVPGLVGDAELEGVALAGVEGLESAAHPGHLHALAGAEVEHPHPGGRRQRVAQLVHGRRWSVRANEASTRSGLIGVQLRPPPIVCRSPKSDRFW